MGPAEALEHGADSAVQALIDQLVTRLEAFGDLEDRIAVLDQSLERLSAARVNDTIATAARLAEVEAAVALPRGLEAEVLEGVRRDLAVRSEAMVTRLDDCEDRLDALAVLEERVAALADAATSLERRASDVADAHPAVSSDDQVTSAGSEGWIAFAPTADGYRLVELPGRSPELGATVELGVDGCEGSLVVSRYGRSPLPFDSRQCAYLDRH